MTTPGAEPSLGDPASSANVLNVYGQLRLENVNNIIQFDTFSTTFDNQAWIYGTLQVTNASYEIDIYDTNNTWLTTITGETSVGTIDETWNLYDDTGEFHADQEFNAEIYITPSDPSPITWPSQPYPFGLAKSVSTGGDAFELAFGWDSACAFSYRSDMIREGVADLLFSPVVDDTYQNTPLNCYDCDPFFLHSLTSKTNLLHSHPTGNGKKVLA